MKQIALTNHGMTLVDDADAELALAAQDWFNGIWCKDCDSRDDTPWNEILSCIISGLGTENKNPGGCWPGYLPSAVEGDNLVIEKSDIASGSWRFA